MTHPRGDASLIINGEEKILRLTLGALADIEDRLGGGDLAALQARLKSPSVADIIVILQALLAGGGAPIAFAALKASDIDLADAARAIAAAFQSLAVDSPGKPQRDGASAEA